MLVYTCLVAVICTQRDKMLRQNTIFITHHNIILDYVLDYFCTNALTYELNVSECS